MAGRPGRSRSPGPLLRRRRRRGIPARCTRTTAQDSDRPEDRGAACGPGCDPGADLCRRGGAGAGAGRRGPGSTRRPGGDRRAGRPSWSSGCGERASPTVMEAFLAEYGLSTDEGVGLMCLAEALLRVPDAETIDELIADKIEPSNWGAHLGQLDLEPGQCRDLGADLTGRRARRRPRRPAAALRGLIRRLGEPVVRPAVGQAMKLMGRQFVLGETIGAAMERAADAGGQGLHLFLRHARRGGADRRRRAALCGGLCAGDRGDRRRGRRGDVAASPGISVKLSALHPRYEWTHRGRGDGRAGAAGARAGAGGGAGGDRLQHRRRGGGAAGAVARRDRGAARRPGARRLGRLRGGGAGLRAAGGGGDRLARRDWRGGTTGGSWCGWSRAPTGTPRSSRRRRRGCRTSRSSPASPRRTRAISPTPGGCSTRATRIYPQFATHNAHTVAAVLEHGRRPAGASSSSGCTAWARRCTRSCASARATRCRIYAPVGAHRDLLAYLVRRLLENGANSSFVNQIVDKRLPAAAIAADPLAAVEGLGEAVANPGIRAAGGALRAAAERARVERQRAGLDRGAAAGAGGVAAASLARGAVRSRRGRGAARPVREPGRPGDVVGTRRRGDARRTSRRRWRRRRRGFAAWSAVAPAERAAALRRAADLYEANAAELTALATREAGKTLADAISEVREAVDFLRYYADAAEAATGAPRGRPRLHLARGTFRWRSSPGRSRRRSARGTR